MAELAAILDLMGDIGVCLLNGEHRRGETARKFLPNGDLRGDVGR